MSNFEELYNRAVESTKGRGIVSPQLKPLLMRFYNELIQRPPDLKNLKGSMVDLLLFLSSSVGRTDVNCVVTDFFVNINDNWERDWSYLPWEFQIIIEDIGGALHDTFSVPDIAMRLDSTPEQLLSRIKKLEE